MSTSAPRCSPRVIISPAPRLTELEGELLDRGVSGSGLGDLEGVQAADDDPDLRAVGDLGDRRVTEDRPLCDQLAALGAHRGDLHCDPRAQPRSEASADLEAEQATTEQRVAVSALGDRRRHRVDDRLGEALGPVGERPARAVAAERRAAHR